MVAARGVLLTDRGDLIASQLASLCEPHERRPRPAMDEGELTVDELEAAHIVASGELRQRREDRPALRVRPPAADDRLARDRLGHARHRAACAREHDLVLFQEREPARPPARCHRDMTKMKSRGGTNR
jgi:hypothetical protein